MAILGIIFLPFFILAGFALGGAETTRSGRYPHGGRGVRPWQYRGPRPRRRRRQS